MELAVNMPEQEPQVGQALRSDLIALFIGETLGSAPWIMASTRSSLMIWSDSLVLPASIGPPETKITGMLMRRAAISIPG